MIQSNVVPHIPAWWFTNFGFFENSKKCTYAVDLAHALIWTRNEVNDSLLGSKNKNKFNLISAVAKNKLGSRRKKKLKVIDELKLFETELESVPEFGGFGDLFHSFELYRGKVSDDGMMKIEKLGHSKEVLKYTECQFQKTPNNQIQLMECSKVFFPIGLSQT